MVRKKTVRKNLFLKNLKKYYLHINIKKECKWYQNLILKK